MILFYLVIDFRGVEMNDLWKNCALVLSVSIVLYTCSCDSTKNSESLVLQESKTTATDLQNEESKDNTITPPTTTIISSVPTQSKYYYSVNNCNKYSITDGWTPFDIAVPVPLEDYLTDNTFSISQLATDFGWKERDGYYYYDCQDFWVYFSFTYGSNIDNDTSLDYGYICQPRVCFYKHGD